MSLTIALRILNNIEGNVIDLSSQGLLDNDLEILIETLSQKTGSFTLDLNRNNLTSKSAEYLAKLTNIHTLNLSYNNFTDKEEEEALLALFKNPKIKVINLSENSLTDAVLPLIKDHSQQETISLHKNRISDEAYREIMDYFKNKQRPEQASLISQFRI
jgi:Ran GTPase-activating protein (RanGAP) involved in mRNA processing and transport